MRVMALVLFTYTWALFSDSAGKMDAPKHHKGMWPEGVQQPNYKVYTWLTYHDDEKKKDEPEHLGPHPFVCKPDKGEIGWHRWYSDSYHNMHNPPDTPPSTGSGSTAAINPGPPQLDVVGVPVDPNTGAQIFGNATPAEVIANSVSGTPVTDAGKESEESSSSSETATTDPKKKGGNDTHYTINEMANENTNTVKCYYYSPNEQGCGTMLWRAQHYATDSLDYRNWFGQSQEAIESEKKYTPSVARLEAFGHQNPQEHRGPYCPGWNYTAGDEPDGTHKGRNECKTSNGGVVFMPPQYGVENYAGLISDPTAESTSSFIFAPGTKLAFGLPDLETGKLSTTEYETANGGFSVYVHTDGQLHIDTADGVNAMYIKPTGTVVVAGNIEDTPVISATTKVETPTIEIEILEAQETLGWAKASASPDPVSAANGILYTKADGDNLQLWWKTNTIDKQISLVTP